MEESDDNDDGDHDELKFRFLSRPLHITTNSQQSQRISDDDTKELLSKEIITKFRNDGFVVFPHFFSLSTVMALNERLEFVLRGVYDRNDPTTINKEPSQQEYKPDKIPRRIKSKIPPSCLLPHSNNNNNDHTHDTNHHSQDPIPIHSMTIDDNHNNDDDSNIDGKKDGSNMECTASKKKKQSSSRGDGGATATSTTGSVAKGPLGFSGNLQNVKVIQIINIHKSDWLFRSLVTCEELAKLVTVLAGWNNDYDGGGARLAQDQIWAKPPGSAPLVFHRDSPYFMFLPNDVITVWIALDDMEDELGPLEYVHGSHLWKDDDGRVGSSQQFFNKRQSLSLLYSAAQKQGIVNPQQQLQITSMAGLKAGGISIHYGTTWHGSGPNTSKTKPRRGIGLHYVPAQVQWTPAAKKSKLWKSYIIPPTLSDDDIPNIPIDPHDFPLCYSPPNTTTNPNQRDNHKGKS